MRTPLVALSIASLAALAFAGCAGVSGGSTAFGAASDLDDAATAWSDDAVLLGLIGVESSDGDVAGLLGGGADDLLGDIGNATDPTVGDGRAPVWGGAYFSEAKGALVVFLRDADGTRVVFEQPLPEEAGIPAAMFAVMEEMRGRWTVDSPAAAAALRTNATLDAAIAAGPANVVYFLNLFEGAWEVSGQAGTSHFNAQVDFATAELLDVDIRDVPLPPIDDPIGVPQPPGELPQPIHETGTTMASADPLNLAFFAPCSTPTSRCVEIPFNVTTHVSMDATLSWGNVANDYDFYILDEDREIVVVGASQVGTVGPEEHVVAELEPGTYMVQVVPWSVVQDTWTFDGLFEHAA